MLLTLIGFRELYLHNYRQLKKAIKTTTNGLKVVRWNNFTVHSVLKLMCKYFMYFNWSH
jgi:hypothetical protein